MGGTLDNGWGRPLKVSPERVHTTAVAQIGQSCSRDALRQCVLNLPLRLAERLRLSIHDELVFELDTETLGTDTDMILASMRFDLKLGALPVPIYATASPVGFENLSECYR